MAREQKNIWTAAGDGDLERVRVRVESVQLLSRVAHFAFCRKSSKAKRISFAYIIASRQ
jgi:hypothetical protein